ncbi:MAG: CoA-transferase, partial [Candidatus Bathyarchaeia archaeon]
KTDLFKYLEELGDIKEITCPFTGQKHVALRTPKIDVFILHAPYADPIGNVQMERGSVSLYEQALMASKVIVTVEEVISTEDVMRRPYDTVIPGKFVDAVVKVPYGAHPMGMGGFYDDDRDHLMYYAKTARAPEGFREYVDKYVFGVKDHWEYLNLIGLERLLELRQTRGV